MLFSGPLLSSLLIQAITSFARSATGEQKSSPHSHFQLPRRVWCVKEEPEQLCWTDPHQSGGWKEVYYDSWRAVVMKEACGVR